MHPLAEIEHENGIVTYDDRNNVGRGTHSARVLQFSNVVGDPPCDGCPLRKRCGERLLACGQFYQYAEKGSFDRDWVKQPTRALYRSIMAST